MKIELNYDIFEFKEFKKTFFFKLMHRFVVLIFDTLLFLIIINSSIWSDRFINMLKQFISIFLSLIFLFP